MTDTEYLAEKTLRQAIATAIEFEDSARVGGMLQSLTYEVEDGEFEAGVKWNKRSSDKK